jgi:NAD(P)-dependent dehydrogenase (short-subunit alcohol dehydrogenase family)
LKPLEKLVAIVSGAGRPSGMGRAAALKLAEYGADVTVADRVATDQDWENLQETSRKVEEIGSKSIAIPVDVTDQAQIEGCVSETIATFGRIDILFNNAGVFTAGPFFKTSIEMWQNTFNVNLFGMVRFCRQVIPIMLQQGGGVIINNSSLSGLGAIPECSAYTASKFAVIGLTNTLALEYGPYKIRVNAVCPGLVDTQMGAEVIRYFAEKDGLSLEEAKQAQAVEVPLQRYARAEEVAEVVAFLASSKAGYITGVAIPVAGGLVAGL